jgi:hypothetical protein
MANNKWYMICDTKKRIALDYLQLPAVWKDVTNMWDLTDEQLANISEISVYKDLTIISLDKAREQGFMADSIDYLLMVRSADYRAWVRSMRDATLAATDSAAGVDRFKMFDAVGQAAITRYREALRNITEQNLYAIQWPSLPPELDFVRKVNLSNIARPGVEFSAMLDEPAAPKTLAEIRDEQWLRIKEKRDALIQGGIKLAVDGKDYWFWTDAQSRVQYSILDSKIRRNAYSDDVVLAEWKTMSGEFVPMTVGLLHRVIDAGIDNEGYVFQLAEMHRQNLMASLDPINYDYSADWPETYEVAKLSEA